MAARRLTAFAGGCSLLFILATLWALTVQGHFEPSRLDVAHLHAGAGDSLLIIRALLGTAATLSFLIMVVMPQSPLRRVIAVTAIVSIVPLFLWSAVGRERWAPGYSHSRFVLLWEQFHSSRRVLEPQVLAALGPPLMTHSDSDDVTRWSYSYMPSSGFGWAKRIIYLRRGIVVGVLWLDEP